MWRFTLLRKHKTANKGNYNERLEIFGFLATAFLLLGFSTGVDIMGLNGVIPYKIHSFILDDVMPSLLLSVVTKSNLIWLQIISQGLFTAKSLTSVLKFFRGLIWVMVTLLLVFGIAQLVGGTDIYLLLRAVKISAAVLSALVLLLTSILCGVVCLYQLIFNHVTSDGNKRSWKDDPLVRRIALRVFCLCVVVTLISVHGGGMARRHIDNYMNNNSKYPQQLFESPDTEANNHAWWLMSFCIFYVNFLGKN